MKKYFMQWEILKQFHYFFIIKKITKMCITEENFYVFSDRIIFNSSSIVARFYSLKEKVIYFIRNTYHILLCTLWTPMYG